METTNNTNTTVNTNSVHTNLTPPIIPGFSEIFTQLKIPDAVKDLPNFDGNPRTLYDFISNVEEILSLLQSIDGTNYARVILRAIRNKITGQANEVLNMYGTTTKWEEIKTNLIIHYSDKRNETSLIRDLHRLKQGSETVEIFYSKVIEILSTILNHIKVHETNSSVILSKQTLYYGMCLNIFLSGLREPLGSTIRATRPKTLAEALNCCLTEQNIYYVKNNMSITNSTLSNKNSITKPAPVISNFNPRTLYNLQPPSKTNNTIIPRFNNIQSQNLTSNLFKPPQISKIQPQNNFRFNNSPPNFQANKFNQKSLPEPMDTTSGNTSLRPFRPAQQPNNVFKPKFTSEELFNVQTDEVLPQDQNFTPQEEIQKLEPREDKNEYVAKYLQSLDSYNENNQEVYYEPDDTNFY